MMSFGKFFCFLFCLCVTGDLFGQSPVSSTLKLDSERSNRTFPLVYDGKAAALCVDEGAETPVKTALKAFAGDIERVSGHSPAILQKPEASFILLTGVVGKSSLLNQLEERRKLSCSDLKGKWETFKIFRVSEPFPGVEQALVVAGSDKRGAAYGVFELSRLIGVDPFYWWADIHPDPRKELLISGSCTAGPPSVKYRGIFLNDEDWGLQPWAAKTLEPETGDIGPKTYAKIFELLLRLRANLIWPAMHPSTRAFFHYPANREVADEYGIVLGSSHAEPMLRNNVDEWDSKRTGAFNYITNQKRVYEYWESRVKESSGTDAIYSLGMRGVHDSGMEGVKSPRQAIPLLEQIISDQRSLLRKYINKNVASVPQAFTAYKEVLDIYDAGLKLPEDVTLVWPDDNYGYIHRLNNQQEADRRGGSGVYYHASYWGRPHDYLWLSSTHPALIREEMMKAWKTGAGNIWVLNVGDIKPLEYNIELFMDMAYRAEPFQDAAYSQTHLVNWARRVFGNERASAISEVLWKYYSLAFERRPEFMGWSQTEPTTPTRYTTYNHFYYNDEAQRRLNAYLELEHRVKSLRASIPSNRSDAFYELVYYPVTGASLMNQKFLYRDKAFLYARQNRLTAFDYAEWSKQAYEGILAETSYYNEKLAGGKWRYMMSMAPRNLPVYQAPLLEKIDLNAAEPVGLVTEGMGIPDSSVSQLDLQEKYSLPVFNRLIPEQYFVDLFLSQDKSQKWSARSNAKWLRVSERSGELLPESGKREKRLWVSVDWTKAPRKERLKATLLVRAAGKKFTIDVRAFSPAGKFSAGQYIEHKGYVSIPASGFTANSRPDLWQEVPGLGRSGKAVQSVVQLTEKRIDPNDKERIRKEAAVLEYSFFSFTASAPDIRISTLPSHPLNDHYGNCYAVSVDDGDLTVLDFETFGRSQEWKQNVLSNSATRTFKARKLSPGWHKLRIYRIDPAVALDQILIDFGGAKKAYGLIPETRI